MKVYIDSLIPTTVFKFNPSSSYSREALIEHYLFASHPYHLNDLMDGRYYLMDMRGITSDLYNEIKRQIVEQAPLIVGGVQFNQMCPEIDSGRKILQKGICDSFFCFGGIVSLTAQNRFNELLWSHYTHETGYMVEFDTQILIDSIANNNFNVSTFKELFFKPICYKEHPVSLSCAKCLNVQALNLFNATQKCKEWSYEKEWRLIATSYPFLGLPKENIVDDKYTDVSKRKLYYDFAAVKRIYLGKKFWLEHIEYLKEVSKTVDLYVVKRELIPFIRLLKDFKGEVYVSASCDCGEFRFGTDKCVYDTNKGQYVFEPEYYYLTRSFERIKNISIDDNIVFVEYEGLMKTRNEEFNS